MADHRILLHKLEHYGVRGTIFKWFTSYFTEREQYVHVNNHFFDPIILYANHEALKWDAPEKLKENSKNSKIAKIWAIPT